MLRFRSRKVRLILAVAVLLLAGVGAYHLGWAIWAHREYAAANKALEHYDYRLADEHLQRYLSVRPGDAAARLLAAQTARRRGDFTEAVRRLRQAEKDGAAADAVATERQLMVIQNGDLADAGRLARFCEEHPDDPGTVLALEVLIEGGLKKLNLSLAGWAVDRWLAHRKGDFDQVQGLLWRGRVNEFSDDLPRALADYRRAVELVPDHLQARLRLAEALIRDEPRLATPQLEWLSRNHPDEPEVRFLAARLRRQLGQPEEAARLLDQLLASTPEHVPALVERGRVALDMHRPEQAEHWLQKALSLQPEQFDVNLALADCMREAGHPDAAKQYQERAREIDMQRKRKASNELNRNWQGSDGTSRNPSK